MSDTPTPRHLTAADADAYEAAERTPPRAVTTVHLPDNPAGAATELTRHDQEHGHYEDGNDE